jgi:hypothetical protein
MQEITLPKRHFLMVLQLLIELECIIWDYDQDGEQDLFCRCGFKRPNDLDYVKYYSNDQIKAK